jgi:hypothetical protein
MYQYLTLGFLLIVIIYQYLKGLKSIYKITYYEARLEHNGFNIDHVKNKSFWSIMTD